MGGDQAGQALIRIWHNCLIVAELAFKHDKLVGLDTSGHSRLIGKADCVEIDPWSLLAGQVLDGRSRNLHIGLEQGRSAREQALRDLLQQIDDTAAVGNVTQEESALAILAMIRDELGWVNRWST